MKILCTGGSGFIGTHFMDWFLEKGIDVLNVDIKAPQKTEHLKSWVECDILNYENLKAVFTDYQPTHVVHLAARAVMEGKSLDDFKENTDGTKNILEITKITQSVSRIIVTSSQHVRKPGSELPHHDNDFEPLGLYGQSKVITEQLTRQADLKCVWTIIRPTNIWGPYHPLFEAGLWRVIKKGLYFHPSGKPIIRSYGYVGNVIWQIEKILHAPDGIVNTKMFYVGEAPSDQLDWLNAFSKALTGTNVKVVPKNIIFLLAITGDFLSIFHIKFPMYAERFRNLTTSNFVPVQRTLDTFGQPPYSLEDGIRETVSWLKNKGGIWNK